MQIEREQENRTFDTPMGRLTVIQVYRIHREPHSGKNQVVSKQRDSISFYTEGDWLTEEMASELAKSLREGSEMPKWLAEASPVIARN